MRMRGFVVLRSAFGELEDFLKKAQALLGEQQGSALAAASSGWPFQRENTDLNPALLQEK